VGEIFDEVCPLFTSNYFHIGGDENNGKEWNANPTIQQFKKKNEITSNDLQTYFNMKLIPMLKKHNKRLMGWEEIMTKTCPKTQLSMRGEEVMKGYSRWSAYYSRKEWLQYSFV
jgi:hexosaminidase